LAYTTTAILQMYETEKEEVNIQSAAHCE